MMVHNNLTVTQPVLPPLDEFMPYLQQIWGNKVLTNGGPFHAQFEQELARYLGVEYLSLFTNGTLALVTALQAYRISGEVITTPYSFVATSHSLLWNKITPVFVDIDPETFNLDPAKIEAAITPNTTAIMPVHCYGQPCDVDKIQKIADNYNLKVIYDAAHAFGVEDAGGTILRHGDMSILSFHATKVFNTFEGGAIICHDKKTKQHVDHLKNFGFVDETTVVAPGINGKMSEFNAALGLLQLKHIGAAIDRRRDIYNKYRSVLMGVPGIQLYEYGRGINPNFGYFPILVNEAYHQTRDELYALMRRHSILARRYFYPLISEFPMYRNLPSAHKQGLPIATGISDRVLCLPIHPGLSDAEVEFIADLVRNKVNESVPVAV